jgi:hypothetical protein
MRGGLRFSIALGIIAFAAAGPALAQETPVVDLSVFISSEIGGPGLGDVVDVNGDGIFDFPDLPPEGIEGIWDDTLGVGLDAAGNFDAAEFFRRVLPPGFDIADSGAVAVGPCGGVLISYDADGLSIDAAVDAGDDAPPVDIYGRATFTKGNPFQADTRGLLAYWGFTGDAAGLSTSGSQGGSAAAFHDHQWNVTFFGVTADNGGDPNPQDKNRNAGVVDLEDELPLQFRAIVKGKAAIVDLYGPERLPGYSAPTPPPQAPSPDDIDQLAAGRAFCFGEGWIEFVGDGLPFFETPALIAEALALIGFAGILFNARTALTWRSG